MYLVGLLLYLGELSTLCKILHIIDKTALISRNIFAKWLLELGGDHDKTV